MKHINKGQITGSRHEKPTSGYLYMPKGSNIIHICLHYINKRVRFTTHLEDTPENREKLAYYFDEVGLKMDLVPTPRFKSTLT